MPSIKRRARRQRREWDDSHFRMLRSGFAFFGAAREQWLDLADVPDDQRDWNWPAPDALEDMRLCWEQHGEWIKAERERKRPGISKLLPCFGELVFDRGMRGADAMSHLSSVYNAPDFPKRFQGIE